MALRGMEMGGKDLEEERGRPSRPVDVPGLRRSAGSGRGRFGDEDGQCGQGERSLREQRANGRGQWRERGAPEGFE